ncbi:MAG: methyl coenzyme M reductase-arginine methyltransferase Mmp10 [Methanobacterium sp.]
MDIKLFLGGIPGKDCGGFCKFCNFKTFDYKKFENINCRYCPPNHNGCNYCRNYFKEVYSDFKHPNDVLLNLETQLIRMRFFDGLGIEDTFDDTKILVGSNGDFTFYPYLKELISKLKQYQLPIYFGYTTGKGIKNEKKIQELLNMNIDGIRFSIFSSNPEIRRKWMNDNSPEISLKAIEMFSENIDLHASSVVIPGITDLEELIKTGTKLEEWGVKLFTLIRFANFINQGNILNNRPIIDGITPYSFEEFQDIVTIVNDEFKYRVVGLPVFDPENHYPYILSCRKYSPYLGFLPDITSEATIITGKYSEKYLKKIFKKIDENSMVNISSVDKEIGDLITSDDFSKIELDEVKNKVIIPGNALLSDNQAETLLMKDGRFREVVRGPDALTLVDETPVDEKPIDKKKAIKFELNAFTNLINTINS